MTDDALFRRAAELGVQTHHHDVDGHHHRADPAAVAQVVAVLEADQRATSAIIGPALHLSATDPIRIRSHVDSASITVGEHRSSVRVRQDGDDSELVLPDALAFGCHTIEYDCGTEHGETVVVVAPDRMPRDERFAGRGGLFAPTYALWEADQPLPSFAHLHRLARHLHREGIAVVSTLPLSATFLDEPFDPSPYSPISRLHWNELFIDDHLLPPAAIQPQGSHVDWRALAERRRQQLIEAARSHGLDAELTAFVETHPDVGLYARYRAAREADGDEIVERSHILAQFLADQQLLMIADDPNAAALALDLPIGSSPVGFEVWADPAMFASTMSVGAPPDSFFADGQNWGFPPPLPGAMHASGHQLWRRLIERVGRYCDILRIDHAMAVERLWWVPEGFSADRGVYVRYPREELLSVIAASAAATGVTIVGEDLGTVPVEVSEAFARWDVLGMYEEQFHLDDDPLAHIPARSVAGIRTHDMEPTAELVATSNTTDYRARLGAAHETTVHECWSDVVEQMLVRLAASDAFLVIADLDDLIGERRPHNLPGRVVDGLWARRLEQPTSEVLSDPDVARRLAILGRGTR